MTDLCFVTVASPNAAPPRSGARCSANPADLAASELTAVSEATGLEPEYIRGRYRDPCMAAARRAWWVLLREHGLSYSRIGKLVGRDHSSVIDAIAKAATCERTQAVLVAVRSGGGCGNKPASAG